MLKAIQDIREKFKGKKPDDVSVTSAPPSPRRVDHYVTDPNTGATYLRGRVLGRGGFATCHEFIKVTTRECFAAKVMAKKNFTKTHQKLRVMREVEIHKSMRHKNVVGFYGYFEDSDNVYMILENCTNKSLTQLLKARRALPEPEVRYFIRQLMEGCKHIHLNRVVHRDIKLGNLLLDANMELKICDFGLATHMRFESEKKQTICGTPNYIAPEVLTARGHGYEADVWSIGCVMYTLLVGTPPFETSSLEETYQRIRTGNYYIPSHVSMAARTLLQRLLCTDPVKRISLERALNDKFFLGFTPKTVFPLVDHLMDSQSRKSHHRLANGQVKDRVKRKMSRGSKQPTEGEGQSEPNNGQSTRTDVGKSRIEEQLDGEHLHATHGSNHSDGQSSDENKENDYKMDVVSESTAQSTSRVHLDLDKDEGIKRKVNEGTRSMSVAPWDVCMSFVDRSLAMDWAASDVARSRPSSVTLEQKREDDSPAGSPSKQIDVREEIERIDSTHRSAFKPVETHRVKGRRRLMSPHLQVENRRIMEDIYEVSNNSGPVIQPPHVSNDTNHTDSSHQSQSTQKYNLAWQTTGDLASQGHSDDVMMEEEEQMAQQNVQQDRRRRRSSASKIVLYSLFEENGAGESQGSSPSPPTVRHDRRNRKKIIEHVTSVTSLDDAGSPLSKTVNKSEKKLRKSATINILTSDQDISSSTAMDSQPKQYNDNEGTATSNGLRKIKSASTFPTESLEQIIGQLCAERYAQQRLVEVSPGHVTGVSGRQSPVDVTPVTSARSSPAPIRRKKSSSGKSEKKRRHTSLGSSPDNQTMMTGDTVATSPVFSVTDADSALRRSSITPAPDRPVTDRDRPLRRSSSVTPSSAKRKDKTEKIRRKSVGTEGQEEREQDKESRSGTSKVTKVTLRRSQTVTGFTPSSTEPTNRRTPKMTRKKKSSSCYGSTGNMSHVEAASVVASTRPETRDAVETSVPTRWQALNMYDDISNCVEKAKMVEVVRPLPGDFNPAYVTKWVDYSNKYGFGFQMSDGTVGVLFNSKSWMTLSPSGRYVHYHDADHNTDQRCQSSAVPEELKKKVSLLSYFARYMNTYLSMSERGNSAQYTDVADEPATVAVKKWHRTKNTVVMYLSNGTLQVNSLDDHTKVIIMPHPQVIGDYVVTTVCRQRDMEHFSLVSLQRFGFTRQLFAKLSLVRDMMPAMIGFKEASV